MENNESQRKIDNRLLEMIRQHFPSLPLDDRYTDWSKWLRFANAVRSEALNEVAGELKQHNSPWEAWYLNQRAAGVMPEFDENAVPSNAEASGARSASAGLPSYASAQKTEE